MRSEETIREYIKAIDSALMVANSFRWDASNLEAFKHILLWVLEEEVSSFDITEGEKE